MRRRILLDKATVTLYEDIQEFWVAERDTGSSAEVVGCGALHVMWEDLAEVRTLAVNPAVKGAGGLSAASGACGSGPCTMRTASLRATRCSSLIIPKKATRAAAGLSLCDQASFMRAAE